jgi:hypothetical protein
LITEPGRRLIACGLAQGDREGPYQMLRRAGLVADPMIPEALRQLGNVAGHQDERDFACGKGISQHEHRLIQSMTSSRPVYWLLVLQLCPMDQEPMPLSSSGSGQATFTQQERATIIISARWSEQCSCPPAQFAMWRTADCSS